MRAAARMCSEILQAIELGVFTWDDFARYFPEPPSIPAKEAAREVTFNEMADT
jgi:integrase